MIAGDPLWVYIVMPLLIATGAAAFTAAVMQVRADTRVAEHRVRLAEARAVVAAQQQALECRIRAAEETARRQAFDEFLADIRIEDRQLRRGRFVLLQERICFKNIPLTGWVEHELPAAETGPQMLVLAAPQR